MPGQHEGAAAKPTLRSKIDWPSGAASGLVAPNTGTPSTAVDPATLHRAIAGLIGLQGSFVMG